ncbi:MAG: TetR/AcrR family transcriptional regulator [Candidatus Hydrothermia bacterium]
MTDQSVGIDTKQKILRAARDVFGKKGFYETRMEDIATEAGIAKGTLYIYFPSKEELYECLLREGLKDAVKKIKDSMQSVKDINDRIQAIIKAFIEILDENQEFILRIVYEMPLEQIWNEKFKGRCMEERKELSSVIEEFIEDAMNRGIIYKGTPRLFSNAFVGLVSRPIFSFFLEKKDFKSLLHDLFMLVKRAFYINP